MFAVIRDLLQVVFPNKHYQRVKQDSYKAKAQTDLLSK